MKFLLFNAVVAAALVYLIAGESGTDTPAAVKEARATIENVAETLRDQLPEQSASQTEVAARTENRPVPADTPEPALAAHEDTSEPDHSAPLPPVEEERVETLPRHEIREAEAVAVSDSPEMADPAATADVEDSTLDTPEFMTASDRQRELELLAQDMELMFLTKAGE